MKLFEIAQEDLVVGFCNSDVTFRLHNTKFSERECLLTT